MGYHVSESKAYLSENTHSPVSDFNGEKMVLVFIHQSLFFFGLLALDLSENLHYLFPVDVYF